MLWISPSFFSNAVASPNLGTNTKQSEEMYEADDVKWTPEVFTSYLTHKPWDYTKS